MYIMYICVRRRSDAWRGRRVLTCTHTCARVHAYTWLISDWAHF